MGRLRRRPVSIDGRAMGGIEPKDGPAPGSMLTASVGPTGDLLLVSRFGIYRQRKGSTAVEQLESSDSLVQGVAEDTAGKVWATDRFVGFRQVGHERPKAQAVEKRQRHSSPHRSPRQPVGLHLRPGRVARSHADGAPREPPSITQRRSRGSRTTSPTPCSRIVKATSGSARRTG